MFTSQQQYAKNVDFRHFLSIILWVFYYWVLFYFCSIYFFSRLNFIFISKFYFTACDVSTAASAYFHTLNKTCTTNVNVGTLYQVHVFLSSYALVGSLINHIIINMALVPLDLSALAISDIHGTCDVLIRPSSSIILGVYKILVSHLVSKPDPPSSCMQRLVLYNVYSNDRRIYCPDNITKFNVHVITGSQEVQRFQIWYETDNPRAEAAFYVPVEGIFNLFLNIFLI